MRLKVLLKVPFNYNNFIKELEKTSDLKYLEFHKNLLNDDGLLIRAKRLLKIFLIKLFKFSLKNC